MTDEGFLGTTHKKGCGTLVVISQVYVPDPAAVGQHVADVAEEMARRGWRVIVYTANRGYDDPDICFPSRERRGGVEVRRLPLSSFGKTSIPVRLLAQFLFGLDCLKESRSFCACTVPMALNLLQIRKYYQQVSTTVPFISIAKKFSQQPMQAQFLENGT